MLKKKKRGVLLITYFQEGLFVFGIQFERVNRALSAAVWRLRSPI